MSAIKELLKETYNFVNVTHGVDPVKDFPALLSTPNAFEDYISNLAEGLDPNIQPTFKKLAHNLKEYILKENTLYNVTPYQTLVFPLLRIYFPRLVAKDAVTIVPMDKPEHVLAIFRARAVNSYTGLNQNIPSVNTTVTSLPYTANVTLPVAVGANLFTIAGVPASIVSLNPGIEKLVILTNFSDGTITVQDQHVVNTNDGSFSFVVDYGGGTTDRLHGYIDFATGNFHIESDNGVTVSLDINFTVNLERNDIQTEIELSIDTIRLIAQRRSLRVKWSPEVEQDAQALFDVDIQAELVNIMGQQIAIDIDNEIINDLIFHANAVGHNALSFSKTPPASFAFGQKQWYENFINVINEAAATIYSATNIGAGNVVLMNPVDAQILQALDVFSVDGFYTGDMGINLQGLQVGTLNGQYKVLISTVVPQGKAIVALRPDDERAAAYAYGVYIPPTIYPLPYGNIFNLTLMTRYAKSVIRQRAFYVVNITP